MTLTETIERDLIAHLQAGRTPPYPLTLGGIATHFGVSLMPARAAVASLVSKKYLLQGANRRLSINPRKRIAAVPEAAASPPAAPPTEKLVEDAIVRMSLLGDESFLREEAAARRFGVGRTVVRRIFSRLSGSRLIEHVPRRGWRVRALRERDMLEYLDVRETLELRALELAWDKLDDARLRGLLEANSPDAEGQPRLDNRLHQYWIDLAGNRYLREFFDQNGIFFQTLFDRAILDADMLARIAGEHRAILQALLNRDKSEARRALCEHIRGQQSHLVLLYERIQSKTSR